MSDARNVGSTTTGGNSLVDTAETVSASLVRIGVAMVSWPFYLLPSKARNDAIDATTDLFKTVGELHMSLVKAAVRGISAAARDLSQVAAEPAAATHTTATRVPIETNPAKAR